MSIKLLKPLARWLIKKAYGDEGYMLLGKDERHTATYTTPDNTGSIEITSIGGGGCGGIDWSPMPEETYATTCVGAGGAAAVDPEPTPVPDDPVRVVVGGGRPGGGGGPYRVRMITCSDNDQAKSWGQGGTGGHGYGYTAYCACGKCVGADAFGYKCNIERKDIK